MVFWSLWASPSRSSDSLVTNQAACSDGFVFDDWAFRPKGSLGHGSDLVVSVGEITCDAGHRICHIRNRYRSARAAREALDAVVSGRVPASMEFVTGNHNVGSEWEASYAGPVGIARVIRLNFPLLAGPNAEMNCNWLVAWVHGNELRIAGGENGESVLLWYERRHHSSAIPIWEDRASPGLLWRGRLVDGTVSTTVNALSEERASDIPVNGLPLTISRWNPRQPNFGYACKYSVLMRSGGVVTSGEVEGNYFNTIPDLERGGWYLFGTSPAFDDTSSRFSFIDVERGVSNMRQINTDLYAISDDAGTFIFDARSGRLDLLDSELGLGEIIIADNGNIALHGQARSGLQIVRVYDSQGEMFYESEPSSSRESIRDLNMDAAGTFVEFSMVGTRPDASRSRIVHRYRVDLRSAREQEIEVPLYDGMLIGRGHDMAVWTYRKNTLIQHLDQSGRWTQVASIPHMTYVSQVLPDGSVVLDLAVIVNLRNEVVLYASDGTSRGLMTGAISSFNIGYHENGLLVVHGLDQAVVLTTRQ
jgi:hypothetical protein